MQELKPSHNPDDPNPPKARHAPLALQTFPATQATNIPKPTQAPHTPHAPFTSNAPQTRSAPYMQYSLCSSCSKLTSDLQSKWRPIDSIKHNIYKSMEISKIPTLSTSETPVISYNQKSMIHKVFAPSHSIH